MALSDMWDSLPDIDPLGEEGISIESIVAEMTEDYEARYQEITGEELVLYPGDQRKIKINTMAVMLYQLAVYGADRFKQNFLKYAFGSSLRNLGANIGYSQSGEEYATTTLRFTLSEAQEEDVVIPAGTQATEGEQIFFAINEDLVIPAGSEYADTIATCTEIGTAGNGYSAGQINILVDAIDLVDSVENTTETAGGHDEYESDELRENIYNFPSTYSVAGPGDEYIELVKEYSGNIIDVRAITSDEAVVQVYILLQNGNVPDKSKLEAIAAYIKEAKRTPDTDKVEVLAPEIVEYTLEATYYISYLRKETEGAIREAIEEMADEFVEYTKSRIGRAINPDMLISFANAAGASRLSIKSPSYKAVKENQVARCTSINLTYGGLEKE